MARRRVHAVVHGLVQGVYFRHYTNLKAQELGLDGWVRNLPDGTVETVLEGDAETVARMIDWLHRGSPQSQVSEVSCSDEEPGIDTSGFIVRY